MIEDLINPCDNCGCAEAQRSWRGWQLCTDCWLQAIEAGCLT